MNKYPFTVNIHPEKESDLKRLFDALTMPGMVSLAGGAPNPKTFPVEKLEELFKICLEKYPTFLQYGPCEGAKVFIEAVVEFLKHRKLDVKKEELVITSGGQQALDMIFHVFSGKEITIYTESPTYLGALSVMEACGNPIVDVPSDSSGIIVEELEKLLMKERKFSLLYLNPTFQNPTGFVMSNERREKIVALTEKYDLLIIEDEAYSLLNYGGKEYLPLKYYDKHEKVIYVHSFSKIFCPGLRIGVLWAPKSILDVLKIQKQNCDLHSSTVGQFMLAEFIKSGQIYEHIKKVIEFNRHKRDLMVSLVRKHLPQAEFGVPEGGLFLWLRFKGVNTRALFEKGLKNGIAFVAGDACYPKHDKKEEMRLNFSYPSDEDMEEGIKRLAALIRENL